MSQAARTRSGNLRRIGAACAAALLAALAAWHLGGFTGARSQQAAESGARSAVHVLWRERDGHLYRAQVEGERLEAFRTAQNSALAQERGRLAALADRLARESMTVAFGEMKGRTPIYSDWVYGWFSSYMMAYHLMIRAAEATYRHLAAGADGSLYDAVSADVYAYVSEKFLRTVVRPHETEERIAKDSAAVSAVIESEWARVMSAREAAWLGFLDRHGRQVERLDSPPAAPDGTAVDLGPLDLGPLFAADIAAAPGDVLGPALDAGGEANTILLRSTRPLASRLGILALRLTEAGSAGTAGTVFGLGAGSVTGAVLGFVAGVTVVWSLDYLINQADATMNQVDFDAAIISVVDALETTAANTLATKLAEAIDMRFAALDQTRGASSR